MKPRKPPVAATWLLNRFGLAARNEALMGDLAEEFQNGRTLSWYWKETAVAIVRNGRFLPGFAFASFSGWALQLIPALLVSTYEFPASRAVAGVCGVCLAFLQMRARRLSLAVNFVGAIYARYCGIRTGPSTGAASRYGLSSPAMSSPIILSLAFCFTRPSDDSA